MHYVLSRYNPTVMVWRDGKIKYHDAETARAAAKLPGTYRVSTVIGPGNSSDGPQFTIDAVPGGTFTENIKPQNPRRGGSGPSDHPLRGIPRF